MAIATGSQSTVGYALEQTYGVAPTGTVYSEIRRKSAAGLNLTKDSYDSEEVRIDRQLADSRHGVRRSGGDIETEVSVGSYTDLLGALLGYHDVGDTSGDFVRGWLDGSTVALTETIIMSNTNGRITFTTGLTFFIGDRVVLSGSGAGNNGTYTLTSNTTATTFNVLPVPPADETLSMTVTLVGYRATVGRVSNSFTLERAFTDVGVDQYQAFTGMKVNSVAFSLPATGLATATWNFLGKDATALSTSPISTIENDGGTPPAVYASVSTRSVLAAVNGAIYVSGTALGTVTDLSFTIDNQLGGAEVVGSNTIPESLWGNTQMVTGKLTVLFEDAVQYNRFLNETTAILVFRMDGSSATEWLQFTFPRCKFNSASIGDAVATGLPLEVEFRAILPTSLQSLPSQVVIQTSHLAA